MYLAHGATAFVFEIVKSPCYEFTYSDFTIPTRGPRKVIGISYEAFLHFAGWSSNRKEIHPRKNHNRDKNNGTAQKLITFEKAPSSSFMFQSYIAAHDAAMYGNIGDSISDLPS
jgi:hypothetical protein